MFKSKADSLKILVALTWKLGEGLGANNHAESAHCQYPPHFHGSGHIQIGVGFGNCTLCPCRHPNGIGHAFPKAMPMDEECLPVFVALANDWPPSLSQAWLSEGSGSLEEWKVDIGSKIQGFLSCQYQVYEGCSMTLWMNEWVKKLVFESHSAVQCIIFCNLNQTHEERRRCHRTSQT